MDFYYFIPCNTGDINTYQTPISGWTGEFDEPLLGRVYHISGVTDLPVGCYTNTDSPGSPLDTFSGYTGSGVLTEVEECSDPMCDVTPTPTPTPSITPTPITPTPTPTPSVTPPITPTMTPTPSSLPQECYEGSTNGTYFYIDCCGFYQSGNSVGDSVTIDTNFPNSGITINFTPTSQICDFVDLDYDLFVSGTCDNASGGTITIIPIGGVPPFSIVNTVPGTLSSSTSYFPFEFTGLTEGNYNFILTDSSSPNQTSLISFWVDGCLDAVISDFSGTTCGGENGYLQVSGDSLSLSYDIDLYLNGSIYLSTSTSINPTDFAALPNGEYYAIVTDFGGATAQTQNIVISGTSSIDYDLSVTGTSNCGFNEGAISVTGETGEAPFTYLWSNGETGSTITGLSASTYSVTVTDAFGCELTKSAIVNQSNAMDLVSYTTTPAGCLTAEGILTVYISGGTSPYTYLGQNGHSGVTSSQNFTFTGATSGLYSFTVTDSYGCVYTNIVNIPSTGGLDSVSYTVNYTNCGSNATLNIFANGTGVPFTYGYTGQTSGGTSNIITSSSQAQFTNLVSDTYDISVESSEGCCYSDIIVISATPKFDLSIITTGATCGGDTGSVNIQVGTGYTSPLNYVLSDGQNILNTVLTGFTFYNLSQGGYVIEVTDGNGCVITENFIISGNTGVNVAITKTECSHTTLASLTANTLSGDAPFTYLWSNGETGSTISNLTAGTYSVTVTDSNGCVDSASIVVNCTKSKVIGFPIYNVCKNTFTTTIKKRGFIELAGDGYLDLIQGLTMYTGCTFNSMVFNYDISYSGQNASGSFYTGNTISDVPTDDLWVNTIESVISGFTGIQGVSTDIINNIISITGDCNNNEIINIDLRIDYDLDCINIPTPTPTPTPTPSNTVTPTPTISYTPTPTPTS